MGFIFCMSTDHLGEEYASNDAALAVDQSSLATIRVSFLPLQYPQY